MSKERIGHDVAMSCATSIIKDFEQVFNPGEIRDAHEACYIAIKTAVELAFAMLAYEQARLKPCSN